ncbi:MAG: hypothetical protein ABMB14_04070 [Myxococcota bacterium]
MAPAPASDPAGPDPNSLADRAADAYRRQDWPAFVAAQRAVVDADPGSDRDRYNLACGLAQAGDRDGALAELRGLLARGIDFGAAADPDFASLRGDPEFEALIVAFDALFSPVSRSVRAFAVTDRADLAPEGIAHDADAPAGTGRFFVGSMATGEVFAVTDGVARPFATLAVDGVPVSAVGLAVDAPRGRLWAIGTATDLHRDWVDGQPGVSALIGLDLATGSIREVHRRAPGGGGFGFNDLAVAPDGAVYLSGVDVHVVRPGDDAATVLGVQPPIHDSNGIALGADPGVLFVSADGRGIARIDLATRARTWLAAPPGSTVHGFDGLYHVDHALVGVEIGAGRWRVVRLDLDPTETAVTRIEVLEQENPAVAGVTTAAVVGPDLYWLGRDLPPDGVTGPAAAWAGRAAVWRVPIRPD